MIALHGGQIPQLPLFVQLGIPQQHEIIPGIQFAGNAGGELPYGLGTDAGCNDAHLIHPSGAQSLCCRIRAIAGFFHHFPDDGAFLFAERPAIQIAADCRTGYSCHFCNITDGHCTAFPSCAFRL